ncbi:MAG: MurR/RpiR family transcriptional regulator [Thermoleophilia bacterium]
MPVPQDVHALAERLTRDYERFSPAQQSLARYLVDHLADVPLMSAHEVARASHCSPATVVRFAQALGYAGYPEMQGVVRRAQRPTLPPRPGDQQLDLPLSAEGLDATLAAERLALDDTARRLAGADLAPLVGALTGRSHIVIAGEGHARPVVALFEERLGRGGRPVVGVTTLDPTSRVWLDSLSPDSAVLAIAVGREARVAQAAVTAARAAGAPAAVLVDSGLSPLARSPLARVLPADVRDGSPSLVAMVAVAQAISAAVAPAVVRGGLAAVGA